MGAGYNSGDTSHLFEPSIPHPVPRTGGAGKTAGWTAVTGLRATQAVLRAAGTVLPDATAAWCHRLYFTTRRRALQEREKALLASGEPLRLPWRSPSTAPYASTGELRGWSWGKGPSVLLVHGWQGCAARLALPYVAPLTAAGFRVVAYDLPGHGASTGARTDFTSFRAAICQISEAHGPFVAGIAHSLGAPSLVEAIRAGVVCPTVVSLGAIVWLDTLPRRFSETLRLSARVAQRWSERIHHTYPSELWETTSLLGPVCAGVERVLFVHDREDSEAHWTGAVAAARHWPRAELELTTGLGHNRVLSAPAVVSRVVRFISPQAG